MKFFTRLCAIIVLAALAAALTDTERALLASGGTLYTRNQAQHYDRCPQRDIHVYSHVYARNHDVSGVSAAVIPVITSNSVYGKKQSASLNCTGLSRIKQVHVRPHPYQSRREQNSVRYLQHAAPAFSVTFVPLSKKRDVAFVHCTLTYNLSVCDFDVFYHNHTQVHLTHTSQLSAFQPRTNPIPHYNAQLKRNPANASETLLSMPLAKMAPGENSFALSHADAKSLVANVAGDEGGSNIYESSITGAILSALQLLLEFIIVLLLLRYEHKEIDRFDMQANSAAQAVAEDARTRKKLDNISEKLDQLLGVRAKR